MCNQVLLSKLGTIKPCYHEFFLTNISGSHCGDLYQFKRLQL